VIPTDSRKLIVVQLEPLSAQPSLRAMEEIAWVLRSDPKKNEVLFVKRTELTRLMRSMILHKGNA
jgi:hypothetical protein